MPLHAIDQSGHLCGMQCVLHQVSPPLRQRERIDATNGPYPHFVTVLRARAWDDTAPPHCLLCLYDHELSTTRHDIRATYGAEYVVVPCSRAFPVVDCPDNIRRNGSISDLATCPKTCRRILDAPLRQDNRALNGALYKAAGLPTSSMIVVLTTCFPRIQQTVLVHLT